MGVQGLIQSLPSSTRAVSLPQSPPRITMPRTEELVEVIFAKFNRATSLADLKLEGNPGVAGVEFPPGGLVPVRVTFGPLKGIERALAKTREYLTDPKRPRADVFWTSSAPGISI